MTHSLPKVALGLPLVLSAATAFAGLPNEDLMCRPDEPRLDKYGFLRALSLDLRGNIPTPEEYAALAAEPDVPESTIDAWLASEDFVQRAVRYHRDLLWNNIDNVRIGNYRQTMRTTRIGNEVVYWRTRNSLVYRGIDGGPCLGVPATYDTNGEIEYIVDSNGNRREGWIEVEPYWAPGTRIKVCAYDAQANELSPSGTDCSTNSGFDDPGCGCGTNLKWCDLNTYGTQVHRSLAGEVEMRVASIVREDASYIELFTSRRAFVNGPIVHFFRHQTGFTQGIDFRPVAVDVDRLPNIPYTDYDFHEIDLSTEHAGILTSPAFLLRFQTNRARANRFFDAFLCSPPSPPPGGLPPVAPGQRVDPDLQKRDGCKYCHALLEPTAAHWGRWTERGAGFLSAAAFPPRRPDCEQCGRTGQGCSRDCRLYYVTQTFSPEEAAFVGQLGAYQFRREEHRRNVEMGPRFLVLSSIVDDRFPACIAKRSSEALLGREVRPEEQDWIAELGRGFLADGYRYRGLIKSIVSSDLYRRVR